MGEHETPGQRARRLLDALEGPHAGFFTVWLTGPQRDLNDAATSLARDLIAAEEAHEVTRAALADALRERDEARSILDHVGIALHHREEPHANLPDVAMLVHRDGERSRRIGPLVPYLKRMAAERDEAREHVAALEAERDRLRAWLDRIEGGDVPCDDATTLRRWAWEAGMGRESD